MSSSLQIVQYVQTLLYKIKSWLFSGATLNKKMFLHFKSIYSSILDIVFPEQKVNIPKWLEVKFKSNSSCYFLVRSLTFLFLWQGNTVKSLL